MYVLIIIFLICYIVSLRSRMTKEEEENKKLKKQISVLKEFIKKYIPEGEMPLEQKMVFKENNIQSNLKQVPIENKQPEEQNKIVESKPAVNTVPEENNKRKINTYAFKNIKTEDTRNIAILITGAILIVLSAVVFLMTTWYTIPNILKTVILVCLIAVFFGASNIAKNKFKLQKVSLTFFFIAMAYIPICLYSISIFKLLGEYLSFYGEGKFIYFTISGVIVSVIYYIYYKFTKSKILLCGSILAQELTIILFTCVLKVNFSIILINLSLYNLLLMLLTSASKEKIFANVCTFMPFLILVLNVLHATTELIELRLLILAVNFLILELKDSKLLYSYIFNILYMIASIDFINNIEVFNELTKEILVLLNIVVTYVVENILIMRRGKVNLQKASIITALVSLMILHINFIHIKPYITSIIIILFATIGYKKHEDSGKQLTAIIIPLYFILTGITFFIDLELSYHYWIMFSIICFVLSEFITGKDSKILKRSCLVISHIFIGITYIACWIFEYDKFTNDLFYFAIILITYIYSFFKYNEIRVFKYLAYFASNFVLVSGCAFFKITSEELLKIIPLLTTTGIMLLENKYQDLKLKDDFSRIYLSISKIIVFIFIADMGTLGAVLAIAFAGFSVYNNIINKQNQFFDIIPLLGILPCISNYDIDRSVRLLIYVSITIAATLVSIYKTKISVYTIFSFVYLSEVVNYIDNEYCEQILLVLWALLHCMFEKNDKFKDIFKTILYIGVTSLYYTIIDSIKLNEYVLFNVLGILIFAILVFRNIARKYVKATDLEPLEYIVYGIIYLMAMMSYADLTDAMLFIILIIGVIIYSYMKKYGTLFILNIIAILVNVFYLTKEFWLAIPWWLYLLAIGSILISFAVRNEVKENKEKLSIGNIINKIKDNVEK